MDSIRSKGMQIKGPQPGSSQTCETILRALPGWFGIETATQEYIDTVPKLPTFTAYNSQDEPIGLLSIKKHFDIAAEIYLIAVLPNHHRAGAGRALVHAAEDWLRPQGVRYFQVKTLSASRPCEHYDRTRRFYTSMGFEPFEEMPTLWDPHNPCLIMIKTL